MRILHVISTLDPAAGGVTESVLNLLANGRPGDASEVVTLDAPGAPFLRGLAFPVHPLGPIGTVFAYSPYLLPWLRENRDRFDGIVVHGLWQFCGFAVRRAARGWLPYLVFPHGMLDPYFKQAFPAKHLKKWIYWVLAEYWVLRDAAKVLFTTEEESRLARQSFWLHRWRERVVPFGTVPPKGDPEAQQKAFLAMYPELASKRFLLFLGRIHRKKGCDLLMEAFARLAAEEPDLQLVMAGPDPQQWGQELQTDAARAGLSNRIHWPGMLTGDLKWGAFHAAEAFILPSHQENFGIAVAEAMACAKPVLLSDKVNIAAEVAADGAGFVEADTLEGTEQLLRRWMALSTAARADMGSHARACFYSRYNLRENAQVIATLLKDPGWQT